MEVVVAISTPSSSWSGSGSHPRPAVYIRVHLTAPARIPVGLVSDFVPAPTQASVPISGCVRGMIRCMTRSVLVVDDDPGFRALAARLLAASGLTVIGEADSVSAALSAADRLKPAAILVDAE